MEAVLTHSNAPATWKVYSVALNSFNKFLDLWHLRNTSFDHQLTLYAALMSIWDKSPRTILTYVSAIRSEYKIQVQNEFLLMRLLYSVRCLNQGQRCQRNQILIQHLTPLLAQIGYFTDTYTTILYRAMILLSFHCLLRISEVTKSPHNLRATHLEVLVRNISMVPNLALAKTLLLVTFGLTKTDQTGEEHQFTWCAKELEPQVCPIMAMMKYLAICPKDLEFLFCDSVGMPVKWEHFISVFNKASALAIHNMASYSTHSLCMGGGVLYTCSYLVGHYPKLWQGGDGIPPKLPISTAILFKIILGTTTWVIGDSFAFWGGFQYEEDCKNFPDALQHLRRNNTSFFRVRGMKLECAKDFLESKMEQLNTKPDIVVLHCGTNNIGSHSNVNQVMAKVSTALALLFCFFRKHLKDSKLVW